MMKGKTRNQQIFHVFFDTNCFVGKNFNFNNDEFTKLLGLVKDNKVVLHTTNITIKEVLAKIDESVKIALSFFSRDNYKKYQILRNIENYKNLFYPKELKDEITQTMRNNFKKFYEEFEINLIEIREVQIEPIIDKYFSKTPPFSTKKKHEFPDAIVLAALEKWARENQEKIYLVSKDGDMEKYCINNCNLVSVESTVKLLEKIAIADGTDESTRFFYECFDTNFEYIDKRIRDCFYELKYDELIDRNFASFGVNIKSISINDKALIEIDTENKVLVFYVFLLIEASTIRQEYDDNTFTQIDEDYWYVESIYYEVDLNLYLKVTLELIYEDNQSLIAIQNITFQSYNSESFYDSDGDLCYTKELLYDVVEQNSEIIDSPIKE